MIRTNVQRLVGGRTLALGMLVAVPTAASMLFATPARAKTFTVNKLMDIAGHGLPAHL